MKKIEQLTDELKRMYSAVYDDDARSSCFYNAAARYVGMGD